MTAPGTARKWGECTACMGAADGCWKDKQSQEGEVINSREIRFPSEILCVLNTCFSLPGCVVEKSKWVAGESGLLHRLEQGWGCDPLLHPMEESGFGTHLLQILQHHVRQEITSHAFCPEDRTFSMLHHPVALTNSPFVPWWNWAAFWGARGAWSSGASIPYHVLGHSLVTWVHHLRSSLQ